MDGGAVKEPLRRFRLCFVVSLRVERAKSRRDAGAAAIAVVGTRRTRSWRREMQKEGERGRRVFRVDRSCHNKVN